MSSRIATSVQAADPVSQAGLAAQLRPRREIELLEPDEQHLAAVTIVVVDEIDDAATRIIRSVLRGGCPRVVVVTTRLTDQGVITAVEAGACGLLRRDETSPERLLALVEAAANGDGSLPPDVLGRLLKHVGELHRGVLRPRGLTMSGMTDREVDVLRLVADGFGTADIARKLAYSERTIKNVIHDVTTRLALHTRAQAVAYAVREGLI